MSEGRRIFTHSKTLFVNDRGQPMHFYMKPCKERASLKDAVEHGGGEISMKFCSDTIRLISPEYNFFEGVCYSSKFILDCIDANRIVDIDKYKRAAEGDDVDSRDDFNVVRTVSKEPPRRANYTHSDDLKIINYIIDNKQFSAVKGNIIWQEMERKKVMNRTWQSLRERFIKKILPFIGHYCLPEEQVKLFTNFGNGSRGDDKASSDIAYMAKRYTEEEDNRILRYVIQHQCIYESKGNVIWKTMEVKKLTKHTWQSMKERFRKYIVKNLRDFEIAERHRRDLEDYYGIDTSDTDSSPARFKRRSSRETTPDSTIPSTTFKMASCDRAKRMRLIRETPPKEPAARHRFKRLMFDCGPSTSGMSKEATKKRAAEAPRNRLETNDSGAASRVTAIEEVASSEALGGEPSFVIPRSKEIDSPAKRGAKRTLRSMKTVPMLFQDIAGDPQSNTMPGKKARRNATLSSDTVASKEPDSSYPVATIEPGLSGPVASQEFSSSDPVATTKEPPQSSDTIAQNELSLTDPVVQMELRLPEPVASKELSSPDPVASKEQGLSGPVASKQPGTPEPFVQKELSSPDPVALKELSLPDAVPSEEQGLSGPVASKQPGTPEPFVQKELSSPDPVASMDPVVVLDDVRSTDFVVESDCDDDDHTPLAVSSKERADERSKNSEEMHKMSDDLHPGNDEPHQSNDEINQRNSDVLHLHARNDESRPKNADVTQQGINEIEPHRRNEEPTTIRDNQPSDLLQLEIPVQLNPELSDDEINLSGHALNAAVVQEQSAANIEELRDITAIVEEAFNDDVMVQEEVVQSLVNRSEGELHQDGEELRQSSGQLQVENGETEAIECSPADCQSAASINAERNEIEGAFDHIVSKDIELELADPVDSAKTSILDVEEDGISWRNTLDSCGDWMSAQYEIGVNGGSSIGRPTSLPTDVETMGMEIQETVCLPNDETAAEVSNDSSQEDWPDAVKKMLFAKSDDQIMPLTNEEAFTILRWIGERLNMGLDDLRRFLRGVFHSEIDKVLTELDE